ncbi:MAG: glycosyltransferase family 1 protein [Planctomycetes bacterium]|nr:glycosyltransferase family 1 protein [Planctomycetota bacterium]NOG53637.1 glycosyltransferase family 4 protein [Planctomycetota bacterium]
MRRILHISTRLILGGSQENTVLSCEGQAQAGHEVHLAFGPIYGPEGSMLERVQAFGSITTHEVPGLVRELNPRSDWSAYCQCRELIREVQPDIVHTHSSKAGIVARAAAWKENAALSSSDVSRRAGVVHTIHGLPFHPYESWWRNRVYIMSERWAARRCHTIVTVADAMSRQALQAGVGKPDQFVTVYSGMETQRFLEPDRDRAQMRRELGLAEDDFVIGTIARLAELKGHDDLLDALGRRMQGNHHLKLLWVGDGWWRDRLMARVESMGLTSQVVTPGLVPPEEVSRYIQAMDVLAHPSYREGLPRTVPQALLGGVPVVVYDLDGAPEVCIHEETGLLVPPGDRDALRESVLRLFDDRDLGTRLAQQGRDLCRERFSAQAMIDGLERVYEQALQQARG